jgi:chromosome segregation ATPase
LTSAEQSKEVLEIDQKDHERVGKQLFDAVRKAQHKTDKARFAHSQSHMKLENNRQQAAWHSKQVQDLKDVIERVESELQEMTDSILRLNEGRIQAQETVDEKIASLRLLPVDELQDELVRINLQVAITERSLAEAQLRWQERKHAFEEAQQRHLESLQRLEDVGEALNRLDSEIIALSSLNR